MVLTEKKGDVIFSESRSADEVEGYSDINPLFSCSHKDFSAVIAVLDSRIPQRACEYCDATVLRLVTGQFLRPECVQLGVPIKFMNPSIKMDGLKPPSVLFFYYGYCQRHRVEIRPIMLRPQLFQRKEEVLTVEKGMDDLDIGLNKSSHGQPPSKKITPSEEKPQRDSARSSGDQICKNYTFVPALLSRGSGRFFRSLMWHAFRLWFDAIRRIEEKSRNTQTSFWFRMSGVSPCQGTGIMSSPSTAVPCKTSTRSL